MAEIAKEKVLKGEVLGIKDYIAKYHSGLTPQAVSYAMDNGKIDYVRIGHERLVVMSETTRQYVPNENTNRDEKPLPKKSVRVKRSAGLGA